MNRYKFIRMTTVEIEPTPTELAEAFWNLNADQQAEFFNVLAHRAGSRLAFQLQFVTDSKFLTKEGRHVMADIGDYAEPGAEGAG